MEDRTLVSMVKQFTGLPMNDLIGAPLMEALEANNIMSITQTKLLLDNCFQEEKGNEIKTTKLKPVMIKMELTTDAIEKKAVPVNNEVNTDFSLPLLTIIPISSLAANDIKADLIHMEGKVKAISHSISCPVCKVGEIHFDFNLFAQGVSFSCSSSTCNSTMKLPEDSRDPVKSLYEELKQI